MKDETFKEKEYLKDMKMVDAQTFFKFRTNMTNIKYNYKHNENYARELWKCDSCMTAIDTQSHILWCPAYLELRQFKIRLILFIT